MRVALDTNILVYAEGINGDDRRSAAQKILADLAADEVVVPAQALSELFVVLTRKGRRPAAEARAAILDWHDAYRVAENSASIVLEAMELSVNHRFALWDAIMLAVAARADCPMLLSEDMQHGFQWLGVTIHNPFSPSTPAA